MKGITRKHNNDTMASCLLLLLLKLAGVLIMQVAVKKSQLEAYGKNTMEYFLDVNSQLPT